MKKLCVKKVFDERVGIRGNAFTCNVVNEKIELDGGDIWLDVWECLICLSN